ncbi:MULTISPECIES: SDR family NAD(P)-dependent oxidoreductase [unclassified Paraburkholderia]|uniref:SDR family NAD(P)-dependent oxidoreductase n=1 Tax=unclassified Paraburkholderia TaxID=2615204 RepID=UPI00161F52C5|nr:MULTISPECIES: SDR family oxidoreductase [unclassified Paraburkholderia]MBB5446549.1 NAD(P)-dependent dehydrogenase (short-subunit alcohol dehydrogenase family) [Paraburkholderia sp. WSM4177]MBB5487095.1 NAD(P)-dependent dehydrogenase (short-subunit alcohol dehydrogenase family) [Paraburkholderia sp. WSM4180]
MARIDTLVNNAGIYIGKPLAQYTAEDYAAVMNVNMAGFLSRHAIRHRRNGKAIQRARGQRDRQCRRRCGQWCVFGTGSLTKGGLNADTKSLAIEYARKGIRVNAVAPGIIKSPMLAPETREALGAFLPLGRMGEMSDIADAILFLESASFIMGEILHVDGRQSAGR